MYFKILLDHKDLDRVDKALAHFRAVKLNAHEHTDATKLSETLRRIHEQREDQTK